MDETKRKAEERRRKILEGARGRLEKIGGRLTDTPEIPLPPSLPTAQPNVRTSAQSVEEAAVTGTRPKQGQRRLVGLEKLSAALRMTRRARIVTAVVVACVCSSVYFDGLSPFTLLTINECTVVLGMWIYAGMIPGMQRLAVEELRREMQFRRGCGLDWKPGALYWIPGLAPLLELADDARACLRAVYADFAVFVATIIVFRAIAQKFESHENASSNGI